MKSSFAKTFEQLSLGKQPSEERYQKQSSWRVEADGQNLAAESIYVLKADMDLQAEISAVTDILVKPEQKERYDRLVVDLEAQRQRLLNALQRTSKLPKKEIEKQLPVDFEAPDLLTAIKQGLNHEADPSLSVFSYNTIFDPKAIQLILSDDFQSKAREFNQRYEELFATEKTIYTKGQFNPARAEAAFDGLKKEKFFDVGHRVQLRGDRESLDQASLDQRILELHTGIDSDQALQRLRKDLSKTAQTRAFTDLIESLNNHQFDYLGQHTRLENERSFRQDLWINYLHQSPEATAYRDEHDAICEEIAAIEREAAEVVPAWEQAVSRFNRRFVNMPFRLKVANQAEAALGKEAARLLFVFEEAGQNPIEWSKGEVKTLSQGERRAMHILSFIFEVESRKQSGRSTVFICDDPADSFDYKNKHAIVQYLEDLTKVDHFYQIILTHNFDLFRTLARFVHRDRCFSAVRSSGNVIRLQKFEGISNIFIKMWKPMIATSDPVMLASIPFTRNLIEYTAGQDNDDYKRLTSLLHWKENTETIAVGEYFGIYNRLFHTDHSESDTRKVYDLFLSEASSICTEMEHDELKLENKVLISIATRIQAERFMTQELRRLKSEPNYWCAMKSQFGALLGEYKEHDPEPANIEVLEGVGITVSSNIHLNSFMYEPILDLSVEHLCWLYRTIGDL
jgi:hypothetical protein